MTHLHNWKCSFLLLNHEPESYNLLRVHSLVRGCRSDLSAATTVIVVILPSSIATAVVTSGGGSSTVAPESRLPSMHVTRMAHGRYVATRTEITGNPT